MSRGKLVVGAAVIIALGIGGLVLLNATQTSVPVSAPEPEPVDSNGVDVGDLTLELSRLQAPRLAQPTSVDETLSKPEPPAASPVGTPLANSRADLEALADSGDAVASCRLALELMMCASAGNPPITMMGGLVGQVSTMDSVQQQRMIDAIAATSERVEGNADHCAGVDDIRTDEIEARARAAAQLGGSRPRVLYALRTPEGLIARLQGQAGFTLFNSDRPPVSQFYADNAYQFLQQGLASRDLLALEGLILVHTPHHVGPRPENLPLRMPNPLQFAVFSGLYARVSPGGLPDSFEQLRQKTVAGLDAEMQARVQDLIDREVQQWQFANKVGRVPPALDAGSSQDLCTGEPG